MNINDFIKQHVDEDDEVLDIGCGNKGRSANLKCKKVITLDAWANVEPDILIDLEIKDLPFEESSFDVVLLIDIIEHFEKNRGKEILRQAKLITKRVLLLLTPLWWQDNSINVENPELWCYGNKHDYHKSLWTNDDFKGFEYTNYSTYEGNYFLGAWYSG